MAHEEKAVINDICTCKTIHPDMSFLEACQKVGLSGDQLTTSAEVFEALFSGNNNDSNKIVNAVIQLMIDKGIDRYESLFHMMFNQAYVFYKGLHIFELIGTLSEIMDIDFFVGELMAAGFNVTIGDDSVLMKMVRSYQNRKDLAMKGSLLIDEEFYNLYVGYQVRI
jgi:hypothetical protein